MTSAINPELIVQADVTNNEIKDLFAIAAKEITSVMPTTGRNVYSTVPVGFVAYGSFGTNTTPVAGTVYLSELQIDRACTLAGAAILNGATVGTDAIILALYNAAGVRIANTTLAGVVTAGANAFQPIAFTAAVAIPAPGRYWLGAQVNGTTTRLRTIAASTFVGVRTAAPTGTFATLPSVTPPTTFTADVGPIGYVYV